MAGSDSTSSVSVGDDDLQDFKEVSLNLENHCLFCLQPQQVETLLEVARMNPILSENPRPIIHYLTGTDPSYDESEEECEEMGIPAMAKFPRMTCPSCYDILAELYRLHEQLLEVQRMIQNQTELIREIIIAKSTASSRQQFYSKIQSSVMSSEEVTTVAKFVDNFYTNLVFEAAGKNKVKFPAQLPPNLDSQSEKNINSLMGDHPSVASDPESSSDDTPKSATVAGYSSPAHSVNTNCSQFDPMDVPLGVEGLDSMVDLKHENEYEDTNDKQELDLPEELDNPLESDLKITASHFSAMGSDEGEEHNFSSSSSSGPSSPEPTTSKRILRKRKHIEIEKSAVNGPTKVSKSDVGGGRSRKSTKSAENAESSSKHPGSRRSRLLHEEIIRPLVVDGSSTLQHCDICGELCPSSEIRAHLETQHHLQDFLKECPNRSCPCVFSCQRKLDVHLSMPQIRDNKCRHNANLKLSAPTKKCEVCRFQTKLRWKLHRHLNIHELAIPEKSMSCPVPECCIEFGLRQSVEEHLFLHNEYNDHLNKPPRHNHLGRKRTCDICPEKIPLSGMQKHLEGHHNLKDYITKCPNPKCIFVFSCRGTMELRHLSERDFPDCRKLAGSSLSASTRKCETCGEEVSKLMVARHLQHHELQMTEKTMSCPIPSCPDRYALRQSVEEHLMTHDRRLAKRSKEQECSVCNLRMKMGDVEEHLKDVHQVEYVIRCRRCPFLFHDWETLLDHLSTHRSRGPGGGFFCDMCEDDSAIKFMSYDLLRKHFFNVHNIGKEYSCEVCERKFFFQPTLASHHQKVHSDKPQDDQGPIMSTKSTSIKTFECVHCPESRFQSKASLQTHEIQKHGAPPITCKICNREFKSRSVLRKHQQDHMGARITYKCRVENCGKVYDSLTSWKNHESGHNTDPSLKLFVCDTCGKRFNNRPCLYSHTRIHMGKKEPRRICDICGESFATAASLKRHNLVHTGERPYQCTICGQAFRHMNALNTHLKSHEEKGNSFKPNGPMKNVRKRVAAATTTKDDQVE